MRWRISPIFQIVIFTFFLEEIQASRQCPGEVPSWLQCTHLNVAAEKNGANCSSSSYAHATRQCDKAIDGRAEGANLPAFAFNSTQSANHSIKIQFAQYFLINKLRVMQLDSGNTQISNVRLEFSNSSSVKKTLTPNSDDAVMEEITFTPRSASWLQLVVDQAGGFKEIEVYYDQCMKERQCDIINLIPSNDSDPIALVDNTVMFSVNMALQASLEVRLTTAPTSDDGYIFKIGASDVTLFRVQSTNETSLKVENFPGILDVGWRTLWLDYRCTNVILGSGNTVILKYNDTDNHQMIHFIKFDKPSTNQIILLCNRQDQCHKNATYYWPLDKAVGDVLHDVQGRSHLKGNQFMTESDVWVSGPTWHSVTSAALNLYESGPVSLIENFSSSCLGNILLCTDGVTVAFWFKLIDNSSDSQRLLYAAEEQTDISITAQSNLITAVFFISSSPLLVSFNVTLHQWHHVTFTWAQSEGLVAVVDFVHWLKSGPFIPVTSVIEEVPLTIGQAPTNAAVYMSHMVVYEMFLTPSQIQRIAKCTDLVPDTASNSFGVITGIVPDDAFTASSSLTDSSGPERGRALVKEAGSFAGAWIPGVQSTSEYLQIDLLQVRNISGIMTQGRDEAECGCSEWVTEYTLSYSLCGSFWSDYKANGSIKHFTGNHDGETIVSNSVCGDLTARVLRFHPTQWKTSIAMRIDVVASRNAVNYLGCFSSPNDMVLSSDFAAAELTPESCVTVCGKGNMAYAGITLGSHCYCSNTLPDVSKKTSDVACYYPCEGDKALKCGSHLYFSVYQAVGEFNFPFAVSVANASEAFTKVQIATAPTYDGAEVTFNFGDGTVIKTKNSTYEYMFTSPGRHEVYTEITVGYYGRCQTVFNMKTTDAYIPVSDMHFICPRVVEAFSDFECTLKVTTGSNMYLRFITPLGDIINGTVEDTTPLMVGFRTPISSSQAKTNLSETNTTIILPNYYFGKSGFLRALKSNTTRAGYIKFQILRQVCLLPWIKTYCFINGSCTNNLSTCSLADLSYSCGANKEVFCQSIDCQSGLLLCPGGAFNSTMGTKYEVVHSSMFYLPEGFHITAISQPGFHVRPADIVAIGTVDKIGAQIISTSSEGNAFVFNSGHLDVGDILLGDGNAALQEIQHRFDLAVIYLPPAKMAVSLGNFPVGNWNQTGVIKTEVTHFIITASASIKNVTWIVPYFVPTNESFNVTTLPHPGHNVTYRIRAANENAFFTKYNQSEWEFFYTWTNISNQSLPMLLDKKGQFTVVLTAVNLLSSWMRKCQLVVMDSIKDLSLFNVTATVLGNDTEISWIVERGTNVTYNISFGDGKFTDGSFSTLAIFVGSYLYRYAEEGIYNVTLTAYNSVSTRTVTGVAEILAPIANLTCKVIHAARDIEVNETIQLNATYPQGSNAKAFVEFADNLSTIGSPIWTALCTNCSVMYSFLVSHSYSTHGLYSANMKFVNAVSKRNCTAHILVHKPVYPLTGFNVTCPPAALNTPTACMLNITGGNDFWCDWDFGADGQKNQNHYWNLTLPVENTYSTIGNYTVFANCSNRLYNISTTGEAIVQEEITGFLVTCPDGQSVDEDFDLIVAFTSGTSMHIEITLKNEFADAFALELTIDTDDKSHTFPVSRHNFSDVGVYLLTVKVVNLVTPLQKFTRAIKVDKVLTNLRLVNNDIFIPVNQTTETRISIDSGTNATVHWDFNDGSTSKFLFSGDSLVRNGDNLNHTYTDHGMYLLNVTASNAVSTLTVTKYLYVQYVVQDIQIMSNSPQEIPPGIVTFTVCVKLGTHPPTNATLDMDFGNGQAKMNIPLNGARAINISSSSYITPGIIKVNMTMRNDISSVNLTDWVDVQRSIKNLHIMSNHTGGDAGYGAPGRGPDKTHFPVEYEVLFVAGTSDGTAVNYTWDFGDGTLPIKTKNASVLHRFSNTQLFNITLGASNSISKMNVSGVVRMMQSILNVSFENDSPTVFEKNTTFTITIGQRGTDSCFLVDLGNNTRTLYKGFDNVSCDNELKIANDTKVLPSLNFTILLQYWKQTSYAVNLTATNSVSNVTIRGWVIILPLPCNYPAVRIPDAGRTLETRMKYFRAEYISIKSRCTIDCLASRETIFQWNLFWTNGTILENDDFDKTLSVLIIPRQTLPYGKFKITLNVSMVGLPLVYTVFHSYLEIMPSPLVAAINGGNRWIQSVYEKVKIDASPSHDPDYGRDKQDLKYIWYCKTANESDYEFPSVPDEYSNRTNASAGAGCLRNGTRRLMINTEVLEIEPNFLWTNTSYIFKLFITKDSREPVFLLVRIDLTFGDVPTMVIKRPYVQLPGAENPFAKLSLEAQCRNCTLETINTMSISWSLRKVVGGVSNKSPQNIVKNETYDDSHWIPESDLRSMTRGDINSEFLILRANSLKPGTPYAVKVKGRFGDRAFGFAEYMFNTSLPPRGPECRVIKGASSGHDTRNILACNGWKSSSNSTALVYDYFYKTSPNGTEYLIQNTRHARIGNVRLPPGLEEHNCTLYMKAVISDKMGSRSEFTFKHRSCPIKGNDSTIAKLLEEMSINGTLRTLEMESYSQFTNQYILSVSLLLNSMSTRAADITGFKDASKTIRAQMSETLANMTMDDVKTVRETANSVAKLAAVPDECTLQAQLQLNKTLGNMVALIENLSNISDSTDLWGTLNTVSEALGSTLRVVTHFIGDENLGNVTNSSITNDNYTLTGKVLIENINEYVKKLSDAFLYHTLPKEEPIQVRSPSLYFTLSKDYPARLAGRNLHCGDGGVSLPDSLGDLHMLKKGNKTALMVLDALVASTPFVPLAWSQSASRVNSYLLSVEMRNASTQEELEITNLTKPVALWIRKGSDTLKQTKGEVQYTKTLKHSFEVKDNRSSINIEINASRLFTEHPLLVLYLRKGEEPTMDGDNRDKVRVIPPLLHRNNDSSGENSSTNATGELFTNPMVLLFSNKEFNGTAAGKYFVIIEFNGTVSGAVPKESTTVNYSLSVYTSECLYWNEQSEAWVEDGCVVGPLSNSTHTQCLCTHMSSFASSFFAPPNKIDWSKVNLTELLNNPTVTVIVCSIFLLYFLLLVWARRKDKRDFQLAGVTPLPSNDPRDLFSYEITVFTGFDSHAGTTADVSIVLTGKLEQTQSRHLRDVEATRRKFQKGNIDYFLLTVPRPLGTIQSVRIWHNNVGSNPSWFLARVLVRDLQTDKKVWFVCDRWLAVEEDDGQIDRTLYPASKTELAKFNFLFSTEVRKNLSDGHLWYSVLHCPLRSSFTRVQRLSCCLSILMCSMLANAMFYKDGEDGESDSGVEVKIGPIRLSTKQIGIGIMSSLVVLPVNLLIIDIFRKARAKDVPRSEMSPSEGRQKAYNYYAFDDDSGEYDEIADKEKEGEGKTDEKKDGKHEKKAFTLPRFTIYIAYVLIFLASTTSAAFTIFYSLTFGEAKSQRWVSSMMISFWQDVIISQPLKVMIFAVLFALIVKDPEKALKDDGKQTTELGKDEEWIHDPYSDPRDTFDFKTSGEIPRPPGVEQLHLARQRRQKDKQMKGILKEMFLYLAFIIVMCVVAYGSRDNQAYAVTRTLKDLFSESAYTSLLPFDTSTEASKFWHWIEDSFVPTLQPQYWYGPFIHSHEEDLWSEENVLKKSRSGGGRKLKSKKKGGGSYLNDVVVSFESLERFPEGFTADRGMFYVVGLARLRQLRMKTGSCTVVRYLVDIIPTCTAYYSWEDEEDGAFRPGWDPMEVSVAEKLPDNPWIWQSALRLHGTPFWGIFASYWGGGFVYNLDSVRLTSMKKIQDLQMYDWIDRYTRAIFAEFTVYNAQTNFFGVVTILTEILPTGGYHHYPKINTIRLYRYTGPEQLVVMAFEFFFFAFLCVYVYSEAKQLFVLGRKYFADPWNYIEIVVICSSFSAIFLYLAELGFTKLAIRRMRANPEAFISFDYIIFLNEAYLGTLGFAVFCAFLKFLKLLRFNRRMSMLVQTVKVSSGPLFSFFFMFLLFFMAYTQAAFLMFGPVNEDYSSFVVAAETLLSMTLGGFDFTGLQEANRLVGPIFFISYMVFIFLVLVNVFVSIVNDSFAEVSSDVAKQTNEHEVVDYIVYCVKEQIGSYVSPPFKPLYKPSLTDFERAVADIEDRAENIVFAMDNLSLEEQRRTNWFKIEKMNEKKEMLIRLLLQSNEDFDEDDFASAIPLMAKFLSEHTHEELKHSLQKDTERRLSQFDLTSLFTDDSFDEGMYEDTEDSSTSSLLDFEQPSYCNFHVPSRFRYLHSIEEENEPSKCGDNKYDDIAISTGRATFQRDVYIELLNKAKAEDNSSQLSTNL